MYKLEIEEHKTILKSYQICFEKCFPGLKVECLEATFTINDLNLQYADITGVLVTDTHLVIKMENYYHIYLPISLNANYYIQLYPMKCDDQILLKLWNNNVSN